MRKIICTIAALCMSVFLSSAATAAVDIPLDGMSLWVSANDLELENSVKVSTWSDKSGNENHLTQGTNARRPTMLAAENTVLNNSKAVNFGRTNYILAERIDYTGDASFVLYYKPNDTDAGQTVFSSHSLADEPVTESGKIPFSISNTENGTLAFCMSNSEGTITEYDMGVSIADVSGYMALYVTIDESEKKVTVYQQNSGSENEISEPVAEFSVSQIPYWEAYAYGLRYDVAVREAKGIKAEIAESMIYNTVLTLDDVNKINNYFKSKYEFPKIKSLELRSDLTALALDERIVPEIVGIAEQMGERLEIDITGFTLTSSDEETVSVVGGNMLKAVDFGTAKVTAKYEEHEISFMVTVAKARAEAVSVGEVTPGEELSLSRKITNSTQAPLAGYTMAAALYKDNLLLDINFAEDIEIETEYTFESSFVLPEDTQNCYIYVMLLDETSALVSDSRIELF